MYEATFTDISDWQVMNHLQTGGTREKCWVMNLDDNSLYFFKVSHKKEAIDYRTEFWMEIIASKFGQSLGLNMLDYNIAQLGNLLGCLSKKMCSDDEELVELMRLLTAYDPTYNPALKESQKRYTFSFVCESMKKRGVERHIPRIIDVLVFDTLIGNQDRHQENWGFLKPTINEVMKVKKLFGLRFKVRAASWSIAQFAPIYDSGSCLARELQESRVAQMLKDENQFDAYIRRGRAELRWEDSKLSYLDLLEKLLNDPTYQKITKLSIEKILNAFNPETLSDIVMHIDDALPPRLVKLEQGLTPQRKEFVIKLINKRVAGLRNLYSQYVKE